MIGSAKMRVWITCFVLLFGAAELLDWLQTFAMPLPIFVLGGAFLAIASNYSKLTNLPFHPEYEEPDPAQTLAPPPPPSSVLHSSVNSKVSPARPLSFTIRKPFQPGD